MKLHKYYSIDECSNEELLFNKLDILQKSGKVSYKKLDRWSIKIQDIDLSSKEEEKLINLLESLDLYETTVDDDDEDDDYYFNEYEDEDDYKPSRGRSYDDNFDDL